MAQTAIEPQRTVRPRSQPGAAQALTIIVTNAMPILAVASLVPSLPLLLKHFAYLPGSGLLVPLILTIPAICLGTLSSLAGVVADRFGRRPLLLIALSLFVIAGVAPLFIDDLYMILLVRVGVGIAEACIPTAGNALLGDYFSDDTRRRWISMEMVLAPLIGSAMVLAGGLLGTISWRAPFALYALGAIPLVCIYIFAWEPERRAVSAAESDASFPWRTAAIVAVVTMLAAIPFFSQNTQHGRIFAGLGVQSTAQIGLYATIASVGTMIGAYFYRRAKFKAVASALALSFGCFAVSFIGLSFRPALIPGIVIDGVGQFAGGLAYTAVLAWAVGQFPERYRARGVGIWSSAFYIGSFISVLLIELIVRRTGEFLTSIGYIGVGYGGFAIILIFSGIPYRKRSADRA